METSNIFSSQSTQIYSTDNSQATVLYITQLQSLLARGDRKRSLSNFKQFKTEDASEKKELKILVQASARLKETAFRGLKSDQKTRVRPGK